MIRLFHIPVAAVLATALASAAPNEPDFYEDVYPFLKANCISCHNKTTTKGDLNMETPELMKKGGDSGPSIVPGKSGESLLVEASTHEFDLEMPPKNNKTDAENLTPAEIAVLKKWIDQGAKSSVREERTVVWQPLASSVDPIYTLAMTKEGRFAACGRSNQIFLYDLATRQFVSQIIDTAENPVAAHKALVYSLAFSPDGTRLASGGFREVKLWKKEQTPGIIRKADPALAAQVSALSSDGTQIVSVDKKGALFVLNAVDGKLIKKIEGAAKSGVQLLSLSSDGKKAAVFATGWDLSIWDLGNGQLIARQNTPDLALSKLVTDSKTALEASTKAEAAATAGVTKAQSEKASATKVLAEINTEIAKAPTPELQQKLAEANAKVVATTQAENAATAAVKSAQMNKAAAEKAANEAIAKLDLARKVVVQALTWMADGTAIATAGSDHIVQVWTLPSTPGAALAGPKELKGATGAITALVAGPDRIAAAAADNKIRIWTVSDSKIVKEIVSGGMTSLDFSEDGKFLASAGTDSAIRIWDVATGAQTIEFRGSVSSSRKAAELEWTIAVQTLEQAHQKKESARIEAQNKALDVLLKKAEDAIVEMTKALPTKEKAIKPATDAKLAARKVVDDAAAVIAKAPDGKPDAAMEKALKDGQDKLITAKTAEDSAQAAFKAVQSNITDAQAQVKRITDSKAKNTTELAAAKAADEASKKLQTTATTDLAAVKKTITTTGARPLAVKFSADAQQIAAVFEDGSINVWAVATGMAIDETAGNPTKTASLVYRENHSFAAVSADTSFATTAEKVRWSLERVIGGEKNPSLFADRVNALAFSPDGKTLATGGGEPSRTGDISLFEAATGKWKSTWQERHTDCVVSLDFSPDGKLLASGAADKIARVSDVATGKQVNLFEGHTHYVMGVAFRADGRVLATAGGDGVVNSWDMLIGERKKKIEGWTKEVTSLQFIGATNQIVTSAGDNLIRIVNDDGVQVRSITKLPDFMQAAASTADGSTVIGGGEDSFLRVWNGKDGKELAAFGTN